VDVEPGGFRVKVGRDEVVVEDSDGSYFAAGTGRQEASECFAGVVGVRGEHGLEDDVVQNAEVFSVVFPGQAFELPCEAEPFK
jgi:hypothetical protein